MNRMNRNPTPIVRRGVPKLVQRGNANEPEIIPPHNVIQGIKGSGAATPSNIIKLGRVDQPSPEVAHCYSLPMPVWVFRLEHVGDRGRRFVGEFYGIRAAFDVARASRNQGIRVGYVDRVLP